MLEIFKRIFIIFLTLLCITSYSCFIWNPFTCRWEFCCPILTTTTAIVTSSSTLAQTTPLITTTTTTVINTTTMIPSTRTSSIVIITTTTMPSTTMKPINVTEICEVIISMTGTGLVPIYKYYDFWSEYCCKQCSKNIGS